MSLSNLQITYRVKYFYMFMMFMWVARTTPLTSFKLGENPILAPVYFSILGYFYIRYCKLSYKPLVCILTIFSLWYIINCIKYNSFQGFYFLPIYNLIIAHVAFNLYDKKEFVYFYEKILVQLCVLSLIVWVGANLLPSIIPRIMHSIAVYESNQAPAETNSLIVGLGRQFVMGIRRNIGFTWEPGRFSCFIILGMYINLIRTRFQLFPVRKNLNFYILLLALVSTLSTTGYIALGLIAIFYMLNVSVKAKWILIVICTALVPSILALSFIGEKIISLFDMDVAIESIYFYHQEGMQAIVPQRFAGLYFDCLNLIHDFWFGYNQNENSYIQSVFFKNIPVWISDGIIQILSKYGIFVGAFFYYNLIRSSRFLSTSFHYKGKYIFAFLFILISISYDFWENCIFMYFYLSAFYFDYSKKYISKNIVQQKGMVLCAIKDNLIRL